MRTVLGPQFGEEPQLGEGPQAQNRLPAKIPIYTVTIAGTGTPASLCLVTEFAKQNILLSSFMKLPLNGSE